MKTANSANGLVNDKVRKILKILLVSVASVIVITFLLKWAWKMSGSGEWKLEVDQDGVKIYSLKSPGYALKQYKGVTRGKYSLNHLVAALVGDNTLENCKEWIPNCIDVRIIEPWNPAARSDTVLWKFELFSPFSPREFLTKSQVTQDPETKAVRVDIMGVPNKAPLDDCCVRVVSVHNYWTFTPQEDGWVEIVNFQDSGMEGLFPDFLLNLARPGKMRTLLAEQLPVFLNKEKYKSIKYDFIEEP